MVSASGCDGDGSAAPDTCVQVDASCTPQYEPTFDQVFAQTLSASCSAGGTACHGPDGAKGGLVFDDPDSAWTQLVEPPTGAARVVPGDPGCSLLVQRLHATGAEGMPPGQPLAEVERCAVERWIAAGALR